MWKWPRSNARRPVFGVRHPTRSRKSWLPCCRNNGTQQWDLMYCASVIKYVILWPRKIQDGLDVGKESGDTIRSVVESPKSFHGASGIYMSGSNLQLLPIYLLKMTLPWLLYQSIGDVVAVAQNKICKTKEGVAQNERFAKHLQYEGGRLGKEERWLLVDIQLSLFSDQKPPDACFCQSFCFVCFLYDNAVPTFRSLSPLSSQQNDIVVSCSLSRTFFADFSVGKVHLAWTQRVSMCMSVPKMSMGSWYDRKKFSHMSEVTSWSSKNVESKHWSAHLTDEQTQTFPLQTNLKDVANQQQKHHPRAIKPAASRSVLILLQKHLC